jgi:hypothetical protein
MGVMSEQPGRYQRSFGGMVGALLVLVLGIGAFVLLRNVNRVDPADPVRPVDYATPVRFAQRTAAFELLTPRQLPQGWIATSVRFADDPDQGQSWHVGFLTDEQHYIGLEQAERSTASMVHEFVDEDATEGGQVDVRGTSWTRWSDPGRDPDGDPSAPSDGDLALVREAGGATTVVVGTVAEDQLTELAGTLR